MNTTNMVANSAQHISPQSFQNFQAFFSGAHNSLFVKNLSPNVTEQIVKEFFGQCDKVDQVIFRKYPGQEAYFAQINFATSQGVTNGIALDSVPLLGVPISTSVVDPTMDKLCPIPHPLMGMQPGMMQPGMMRPGMVGMMMRPGMPPIPPAMPGMMPNGMVPMWNGVRPMVGGAMPMAQREEEMKKRTIHMSPLPDAMTDTQLRAFCGAFGPVICTRIDKDVTEKRFALVEFASIDAAKLMLVTDLHNLHDTNVYVSPSKTTVHAVTAMTGIDFKDPRPANVYGGISVATLAQQSHLSAKLRLAQEAASKLQIGVPECDRKPEPKEEAKKETKDEVKEEVKEEPEQERKRSPRKDTTHDSPSLKRRRSRSTRRSAHRSRRSRERDRRPARRSPRRSPLRRAARISPPTARRERERLPSAERAERKKSRERRFGVGTLSPVPPGKEASERLERWRKKQADDDERLKEREIEKERKEEKEKERKEKKEKREKERKDEKEKDRREEKERKEERAEDEKEKEKEKKKKDKKEKRSSSRKKRSRSRSHSCRKSPSKSNRNSHARRSRSNRKSHARRSRSRRSKSKPSKSRRSRSRRSRSRRRSRRR